MRLLTERKRQRETDNATPPDGLRKAAKISKAKNGNIINKNKYM